jgi:hypothetical protein
MIGEWFVELYAPASTTPMATEFFDDFDHLLATVKRYKLAAAAKDTLRIHVPARATDHERNVLRDYGAVSN